MRKFTLFRISIYLIYYIFNLVLYPQMESILLTLPVFMIIIVGLSRVHTREFGLLDIFWFVSYIMFVIRPIQMVDFNYKVFTDGPTVGYQFTAEDFLTTGVILFVFYLIVLLMVYRAKQVPLLNQTNHIQISRTAKKIVYLTLIFIIVYMVYIQLSGGISNVLLPRSEKLREDITKGAYILFAFLTVLYFYILYIYFNSKKYKRLLFFLIILTTLLMMIISNPSNSPRFFLLATWIPVIFLLFNSRMPLVLSYVSIFFMLVFIFPILSLTTRFGFDRLSDINILEFSDVILKLKYIDPYDMMVYLVHRVDDIGYSYGENFLGMIFFFIPRSIWESKPDLLALQFGNELVSMKIAGTENLSMFYVAELYSDFWFFGVILAGLLSGIILRKLIAIQFINSFDKILSLILLASLPIIIRGPFAAIIGLVFFQIFSFYLIKWIMKKGLF